MKAMQFVLSREKEKGTKALEERLSSELAKNRHVLWLVSGGSNIPISVAVMRALKAEHTKNLVVLLADERYGEAGHLDSNAKQLLDAGLETKDAVFVPPLVPGFSLEETRERYGDASRRAFEHADVVVGQIGIGQDGHIAGLLPHSPAAESREWVAAYETPTYTRITLGFSALSEIDAAYVFAFGDDKKEALTALHDEELELTDQPAQLLKTLPEAYIFNDQIGEKL